MIKIKKKGSKSLKLQKQGTKSQKLGVGSEGVSKKTSEDDQVINLDDGSEEVAPARKSVLGITKNKKSWMNVTADCIVHCNLQNKIILYGYSYSSYFISWFSWCISINNCLSINCYNYYKCLYKINVFCIK